MIIIVLLSYSSSVFPITRSYNVELVMEKKVEFEGAKMQSRLSASLISLLLCDFSLLGVLF